MSTAQERLLQIFPNRRKLDQTASSTLHERELLELEQKRHVKKQDAQSDSSMSATNKLDHKLNALKVSNLSEQPQRELYQSPAVSSAMISNEDSHSGQGSTLIYPHTDDSTEPQSSSTECAGVFCVFSSVIKFPYKFMRDPDDRVSKQFFAAGKAFERNWKVYYVHPPAGGKPLLLVPLKQVQRLISDIADAFGLEPHLPSYPFQLTFFNDGTPLPQFAGVVASKQEFQNLRIPDPPPNYLHPTSDASMTSDTFTENLQAWTTKVETALLSEKKKGVKFHHQKEQQRAITAAEATNMLKRAQTYLGMRKCTSVGIPNNSSDAVAKPNLNLDVSAPFDFMDQPIIIAVDVESYERDHSIITEIGVSTLDTSVLVDVAVKEWHENIRSRHFRIKGREHLVNNDFVHGDPESFQYGVSEFVSREDAAEVVDSCFQFPYSAGFECAGRPETDEDGMPKKHNPRTLDTSGESEKVRSLVLVGHALKGDIEYMSKLGSTIFGSKTGTVKGSLGRRERVLSSLRKPIDTAILYQTLTQEQQPKSLVKVCDALDIEAWYPHNAGNDARYTMEAFLKIVVKSIQLGLPKARS